MQIGGITTGYRIAHATASRCYDSDKQSPAQ